VLRESGDAGLAEDLTAEAFLAAVHATEALRVPFSPAHPGTWRTDQIAPPLGIRPSGDAAPEVQLSFRVDDIAAAVDRVRAAGGVAADPERRQFGLSAACTDNQGVAFRLWQPA
jgi:catechol 2,3-dioxygenase-like lactoylglutathione lyase family enzyme